jgi:hypothetical protein
MAFEKECLGLATNDEQVSKDLCSCTPKYLEEIQKDNKQNINKEMEAVKKAQAKAKLLNDTLKLVTAYKKDLEKVKPNKEKTLADFEVTLQNYGKTLQNAVLINAISELILSDDYFKSNSNLNEFCKKNISNEKYQSLCNYNKDNTSSIFNNLFSKNFSQPIENFIHAYQAASKNPGAGDEELNRSITNIISQIPAGSTPKELIEFDNKFGSKMAIDMNDLIKVFKEVANCKEKCEVEQISQLSHLSSDHKIFMENISKFSSDDKHKNNPLLKKTGDYFQQKLNTCFNEMNRLLNTYFFEAAKVDERKLGKLNREIGENFPKSEMANKFNENYLNFFNNSNNCINTNSDILDARSPNDRIERANRCNDYIQNLYNALSSSKDLVDANKELSEAQAILAKKIDEQKGTRSLQNFIANNYLRNCGSVNGKSSVQEIYSCKNQSSKSVYEFRIGEESKNFFNIVGKLSATSEVDSAFSTSELAEVKAFCNSNTSNYRLVCKKINYEGEKAKGKKTINEWTALHEKYWVQKDPHDSRGYTLTEKKSIWSMIGQSALTSFTTTTLPYAFYSFGQEFNINQMQTQAMMQKQWMWDMNQASNYWMNNLFYIPTTSTTTPFNFTNTNSFNFGK